MADLSASRLAPPPATPRSELLAALAAEAWTLEPVPAHERRGVLRSEAALLLDRLLTRATRGRGALDIALGEGLAVLSDGDGTLRLGYSGLADYARERLGIAGRTALAMARLARELRTRPLLAEAVRSGEVSARKAEVVLPVARGEDEAAWVARARAGTVRALQAAVRGAAAEGAGDGDERWDRASVTLPTEARAALAEAEALAGKVLGATTPRWRRLEAICEEYLGAHPVAVAEEEAAGVDHLPAPAWLEEAKEALEWETGRWEALDRVEPFQAPRGPEDGADPFQVDERLRELSAMRDGWDELVGHLAMLVRDLGLWRDMGFVTFGHYCAERLGMAERTVAQRASLARRLHALPSLRQALRDGRLSYEKARLVARCPDEAWVGAWIERAEALPCVALRRELEAEDEAQMCARREFDLPVPRRVRHLLDAAIRAVRVVAGEWLPAGECLGRIARHFIEVWRPQLEARLTRQQQVIARDHGHCQVPGCSRAAAHAHHVVFRSRGGGDDAWNLVALCAPHHLHGVHRGFIRVEGRAPDRLVWELGVRPGSAPKECGNFMALDRRGLDALKLPRLEPKRRYRATRHSSSSHEAMAGRPPRGL